MTAVDMLDVTHGSLGNVRKLKIRKAGYTTGSPDIRWTAADWHEATEASVLIDQSTGTDPRSGNVKDIERGASNIAEAITWAHNRKSLGLKSTFYIASGSLVAAEDAVRTAGLEAWVDYWIADWNLSRERAVAELGGRIVAIQYASPTTNPRTTIPGTKLTLAETNVDLSVCLSTWLTPFPAKKSNPVKRKIANIHPKVKAATGTGGLATGVVAAVNALAHTHITGTEGAAIATILAALAAYLRSGKA